MEAHVANERLHTAEGDGEDDDLDSLNDPLAGLDAALDVKRDHSTETTLNYELIYLKYMK